MTKIKKKHLSQYLFGTRNYCRARIGKESINTIPSSRGRINNSRVEARFNPIKRFTHIFSNEVYSAANGNLLLQNYLFGITPSETRSMKLLPTFKYGLKYGRSDFSYSA